MTNEELVRRVREIRDDLDKGLDLPMDRQYIAECTLGQLSALLLDAGEPS